MDNKGGACSDFYVLTCSDFYASRCPVTDVKEGVAWAEAESARQRGVFYGANPRSTNSGTKESVTQMVTSYAELDHYKVDKTGQEAFDFACDSPVEPTFVTNSGQGTHVLFCHEPVLSNAWLKVQEGLYQWGLPLGADKSVVTDWARVLRLPGAPNWKDTEPLPTGVIFDSEEARPIKHDALVGTFVKAKDTQSGGIVAKAISYSYPIEEFIGNDAVMREGNPDHIEGAEGRNDMMWKVASYFAGKGIPQSLALTMCKDINGRKISPSLEAWKIVDQVRRAYKYEPNERTERPAATTAGTTGKAGLVTHSRGFGAFMEEKMEDLDFVIQGLYRGGIGQFIAQQSSYKTTLGLNLLLSLACGKAFAPFTQSDAFNLPMNGGIAKPRNVVFLDFENIPKFVQDDLRTMFEKNAFDEYERAEINRRFYPIISPQIRLNDDPDTDTLACLSDEAVVDLICDDINDYFGEMQTDLILIDTQSEAFNLENENDNGANGAGLVIRALNRIAKRTGAAVLLIHHTGKVGEEANQRKDYGRGASRFATAMRYITRFDQSKDSGGRFVAGEITVENVKAKGPKMYDGEKVYFTHNPETRWMVWGTAPSVVSATQNDAPADDQPEPTDRDAWIDWRIGQTGCSRDAARTLWNKRNRP